jgi:sialic acid synthase SpsE
MKQISRKSLVANEEIKKGQIIKKEMLTLKRPGTGLKWEERKQIIGKRARKNISKDQLITINLTK